MKKKRDTTCCICFHDWRTRFALNAWLDVTGGCYLTILSHIHLSLKKPNSVCVSYVWLGNETCSLSVLQLSQSWWGWLRCHLIAILTSNLHPKICFLCIFFFHQVIAKLLKTNIGSMFMEHLIGYLIAGQKVLFMFPFWLYSHTWYT